MTLMIRPPVRTFIRLYTLHQVEDPAGFRPDMFDLGSNELAAEWLIVRVRIETLRYVFAPLDALPVQSTYARDPRAGVELVRTAAAPRLHTLLDAPEPFRELGLLSEQAGHWRQYAAARGLPAEPVRVPVIHQPAPIRQLPTRSRLSERLARVQQALDLFLTAADTAATLAGAWQNWQIGRERRKLLDAQRTLLHDAVEAQVRGQSRAFDHALDGDYVRGYLADHAGDAGYAGLFGANDPAQS